MKTTAKPERSAVLQITSSIPLKGNSVIFCPFQSLTQVFPTELSLSAFYRQENWGLGFVTYPQLYQLVNGYGLIETPANLYKESVLWEQNLFSLYFKRAFFVATRFYDILYFEQWIFFFSSLTKFWVLSQKIGILCLQSRCHFCKHKQM